MGDEPEVWGNVLFFENGSLKKLVVFFANKWEFEQMGIYFRWTLHKTNAPGHEKKCVEKFCNIQQVQKKHLGKQLFYSMYTKSVCSLKKQYCFLQSLTVNNKVPLELNKSKCSPSACTFNLGALLPQVYKKQKEEECDECACDRTNQNHTLQKHKG